MYLNLETHRACSQELFGVACYAIVEDGREWQGKHQGVVASQDEAKRWVDGDDTVPLLKIFPPIGAVE
jgi:hypothetical protein